MARDKIHHAVKKALENDGWTIVNDPFYVESGGVEIEIDLSAEKFLIAEKGVQKILVEIKSLTKKSLLYDFHATLGQYINYRGILKDEEIDNQLYLAISQSTYEQMQLKPFYDKRLTENNISLIIVDIIEEIIVQWIR
jgi:hypothetical protein